MPCTPRTHKPKSSTPAALYAWHPTQTYTGYANAPAQHSKNPVTPCSTKLSQPTSANSWPIQKSNSNLLPQLADLCRALRTGLSNSPHR